MICQKKREKTIIFFENAVQISVILTRKKKIEERHILGLGLDIPQETQKK